MRVANYVFNIFVVLVSLYFLYLTIDFPASSTPGMPGPAFFPRVMLIVTIVLLVLDMVITFKGDNQSSFFTSLEYEQAKYFIISIAYILLFVFFLGKVHFILLASIFTILFCKLFRLTWKGSIITAITLSVTIYLIFEKSFHVLL